jgi:hypothetical protein
MLQKIGFIWKDLAPRRIPTWNPEMNAVYSGRSVSDTWNPERQLIGTLTAQTLLQLESKVRGLAHRKHWRPERQSPHIGRFLLAAVLNCPYYWSNVS